MSEAAAPASFGPSGGGDATPPPAATPPAGTPPPAGDGTPPATPPAGGDGTPPATPPAGDGGSWYGDIEDAELKGWVENKGFKDPIAALTSMKNMEKLVGGDKVAVPKSADDAEAWDAFYKAAGRPDKADDYQVPVPDGDNGEFAKQASEWMHGLGLNTQQARGLAEKWNAHISQMQETQVAEDEALSVKEWDELKKEWGGEYDKNLEVSNQLNRAFDITSEEKNQILGGNEAALAKVFKRIGEKMAEDNYQDGDGSKTFSQTPAGARAEIAALKEDKDFMKRYMDGEVSAKAKYDELYKRGYPS